MKRNTLALLVGVGFLAVVAIRGGTSEVQSDQSDIAALLLDEASDAFQRERALTELRTLRAESIDPDLRSALRTIFQRHLAVVREANSGGTAVAELEDPWFMAAFARTVAEIEDPDFASDLATAIYGGVPLSRALGRMGPVAVPAVLDVIRDQTRHKSFVEHALISLRLIVETPRDGALPADLLVEVREATRQRLQEGPQYFTVVWQAMDLAAVLNDPDLRALLASLADDRNEVVGLGISDAPRVELTQERARNLLAGRPPMPRP